MAARESCWAACACITANIVLMKQRLKDAHSMNLWQFGKYKLQSQPKILEVTTQPQVFNLERDNHVGAE